MPKKSKFYIFLCLFVQTCFLFAQSGNSNAIQDTTIWIKTPLKFVFATIKFPQQAALEKKDIYTSNGLQTLYFIKNEINSANLTLSASMRQVSVKEVKKATQEEINRIAVQQGGYPNVYKEKDKYNIPYDYVLVHTLEGKIISNRIYYLDGYLVILSAITSQSNKNQPLVDFFFNSLETSIVSVTEKPNSSKNKNKQQTMFSDWVHFEKDMFVVKFPIDPNSKTYIVYQADSTNYSVKNYYYQKQDNSLSFLVSERNYAYQLEISADSLFKLALSTLTAEGNGKLLAETNLFGYKFPAKEYVFTSRKAYYRIRYFFANNSLYQVMIAGTKKQVTDLQNEQFFDAFQIR